MTNINRRQMLGRSAMAALGLAATSALELSCKPSEPSYEPVQGPDDYINQRLALNITEAEQADNEGEAFVYNNRVYSIGLEVHSPKFLSSTKANAKDRVMEHFLEFLSNDHTVTVDGKERTISYFADMRKLRTEAQGIQDGFYFLIKSAPVEEDN